MRTGPRSWECAVIGMNIHQCHVCLYTQVLELAGTSAHRAPICCRTPHKTCVLNAQRNQLNGNQQNAVHELHSPYTSSPSHLPDRALNLPCLDGLGPCCHAAQRPLTRAQQKQPHAVAVQQAASPACAVHGRGLPPTTAAAAHGMEGTAATRTRTSKSKMVLHACDGWSCCQPEPSCPS